MRRVLWGLCLAAGVALGLLLLARQLAPNIHVEAAAERPTRTVTSVPIGGAFQLVDQTGAARDQSLLRGRWSAVFFGFTHCPDICPTTLQTLGAAKEALGPAGPQLQLVFISVDPARDTPAALSSYLSNAAFAPGVVGLTGTEAQVRRAADAWRANYSRSGEGDDYLMNHSTLVYLMDPQGRFDRILRIEAGPEAVAREVRAALAQGNDSRS